MNTTDALNVTNATAASSVHEQCTEIWYPGLSNFSHKYVNLHGYIAAVCCVWGIAANIANVVVLTRKNMISTTNTILTWLAVADMLTMASYLPVSVHFYIMKEPNLYFPETLSYHWIKFMLFHINFTVLCHTIAIWLTITLAIFRYLYICYPTRGQTLCSLQRAKISVFAVYISTAIICIPNYLSSMIGSENHTKSVYNETIQNYTEVMVTKYNVADRGQLVNTINFYVQAIFIKLIPCLLLTLLTILLIMAMHQANQRRMKLKSQGKKDESDRAREHNRTTAMLLAVVGLFLLTELPQGILTLCNIFIPCFFNNIYWPLGDLLDIMALLNNSVNFVLYCSMSRQFRDTFVDTFCSCCPKSKSGGWRKVKTVHIKSNGTQV